MKSIWGSVASVGSLMVLAGAFAPACNHTDSSIFIEFVAAPPAPRANATSTCLFPAADPTESFISSGVLDIALSDVYQAALLVGNQLNAQADPESDRTETARVEIQTASVTVTDSTGNTTLGDPYSLKVDGFINPGGGEPGYDNVFVNLIEGSSVTNALKAKVSKFGDSETVIANVVLYGETLGEQNVVSNSFAFPINVCYGCLIDYSGAVIDPTTNKLTCVGATAATTTIPCFEGVDQAISCTGCLDKTVCQTPP